MGWLFVCYLSILTWYSTNWASIIPCNSHLAPSRPAQPAENHPVILPTPPDFPVSYSFPFAADSACSRRSAAHTNRSSILRVPTCPKSPSSLMPITHFDISERDAPFFRTTSFCRNAFPVWYSSNNKWKQMCTLLLRSAGNSSTISFIAISPAYHRLALTNGWYYSRMGGDCQYGRLLYCRVKRENCCWNHFIQ